MGIMLEKEKIVTNDEVNIQQPKIQIIDVEKKFKLKDQEVLALSKTNLNIDDGEFVCVVGPSGCGKTTLLNIIGGLLPPTTGKIMINNKKVEGPGRERGVVFQQYALFPWLTVQQNVEFALRERGVPKRERASKAVEYLDIVGLSDYKSAMPKQLSGGMKQRVAIARAYAAEPEVLLMDEPFGALDAESKAQLQEELLKSWKKLKSTIFFITHDVEEAVFLAQSVIIMASKPGRIKKRVKINLPENRDHNVRFSHELLDIKTKIWNELHE